MTCSHCNKESAAPRLCTPCAAAARERGRQERIAQGLPPVVTDPAAYARLGRILDAIEARHAGRAAS